MSELDTPKKEVPNQYVIFENAEKGLELYLLQKYQAFDKYTQVTNQIEFENYRKEVFKPNRYNPKNKLSRELTNTKQFNDYVFMRPPPSEQKRGILDVSFVENVPLERVETQKMSQNIVAEGPKEVQNAQKMVAEEPVQQSKKGVVMVEELDQSEVMVDENARKRQAANVSQTTVNVQVQRQAEVPQIQVPKNVPQTAQSVTTESTKPNIQVAVTVTEQPKPTQAPSKPIQEAPKPVQEAPKPVQEVQKPAETKPVAPAKPAPTPAPAKAKPAAVKPKDHYEPDSY